LSDAAENPLEKTLTTAKNLKNLPMGPSIPKEARSLCIGLTVSLICLALAQLLAPLETEIAKQITPALAANGLKMVELSGTSNSLSTLIRFVWFICLLVTAIIAAESAPRLKQPPNIVAVSIGLFLLASYVQILLFEKVGVPPLIATSLIATALASYGGWQMEQNIQRKKVMESQYYELFMRKEELADARLALVRQNEIERRILAADLHDQVLNDLKKILEQFSLFEKSPEDKATSGAIRAGFNKTMNDIREIMDDLCPIMLQNFGMRAAIEDCLDKGKERAGYETKFVCTIDDDILEKLSEVEQALLFRLVQESLTNIGKHAQAKNVQITIEQNKTNLNIVIEDDGKGIDFKNISHQSRGLRYMKLRADLIDASVDWRNGRNDKGTKVVIIFPLPS
jgi:signal transduction histidine kinase